MREKQLTSRERFKKRLVYAVALLGTVGSVVGLGFSLAELSRIREERCQERGIIDGQGGRGLSYHPGQNLECEQFIHEGKVNPRNLILKK